jgi:hypothetical protein
MSKGIRSSSKFIFLILAILLTVLTLIVIEFIKRNAYEQINKDDPAITTMVLYSDDVVKNPNKYLNFRLIGKNAQIIHSADVWRNNLGYLSKNDYNIEKEKSEFRVVVLGGEQTASSISETSWPDYLKNELEIKLNTKVSVINLAWPDAGPAHYVKQWEEAGKKFSADLVLINYVETDFYRGLKGGSVSYKNSPIEYKTLEYEVLNPPNNIARLGLPKLSGTNPMTLADPNAIPSRPYGFFVTLEFMESKEKIKKLQERVVNEMVLGAIPCFGCLTLYSIKGVKYPPVSQVRNLDAPQNQPTINKKEQIKYVSDNFKWIIKNVPNPIFIHNFHYGELHEEYELTNEMKLLNREINVVDMRKKIPKGISDENLKSWYLNPMGEKWSDAGHRAYAKLVSQVVMEWKK